MSGEWLRPDPDYIYYTNIAGDLGLGTAFLAVETERENGLLSVPNYLISFKQQCLLKTDAMNAFEFFIVAREYEGVFCAVRPGRARKISILRRCYLL